MLENYRRPLKAPPVPPLEYGPVVRELVTVENELVPNYSLIQK
jgi:hypothetical protein